jgi:CMP-N,N'-diacetyllegionaminic acid synthase
MKRLAVIPARGGSTRLKHKNLYPLGNKPLIKWITETVVQSQRFDKVIISTDNDNIFYAVSDLGVEFHSRPFEFSTTESTVLDAMMNLISNTEEQYDEFAYFLPTCPFVSVTDIHNGCSLLESCDSVVSMTEMDTPIQLACFLEGNKVLPVFDNLECGLTNSKYIKKYYKPSGAFYMSKWGHIVENRNFFRGNVKGVLMPKNRSVDINTVEDIKYAEAML